MTAERAAHWPCGQRDGVSFSRRTAVQTAVSASVQSAASVLVSGGETRPARCTSGSAARETKAQRGWIELNILNHLDHLQTNTLVLALDFIVESVFVHDVTAASWSMLDA